MDHRVHECVLNRAAGSVPAGCLFLIENFFPANDTSANPSALKARLLYYHLPECAVCVCVYARVYV